MKFTILGAGNWGTTAALLLHGNGHTVSMWEFFEDRVREILRDRENRRFLPGVKIPDDLTVTSDIGAAVKDAEAVVFVVPSSFMRDTARAVADSGVMEADAIAVSLSKGLEHGSLKTMTDVIGEELPGRRYVAMSGPCIASEVARRQPTTIVAASGDRAAAERMQDCFMTPYFRVYTLDDPRGAQLGGALKNIVAVAAGINDGLGFGVNSKSALVTRGILEIKRFGESLGAHHETFNGLSGIGDLVTTCFSAHSRNRRLGEEIGRGRSLEEVLGEMVMVAEGVHTARTVYEYAAPRGIDMPITEKVYRILFEGMPAREAVSDLMLRDKKPERY